MKTTIQIFQLTKVLVFIGTYFLFGKTANAQSKFDSLKIKQPKHFFNTVIVLDSYGKPNQKITDTTDFLDKRLKSYGVKQFNLSFYTPISTINKPTTDSNVTKNTHVLLTGNFMSLRPVFDGISQHTLIKAGIGIRAIFNSGKKGIWFVDVSPFVTKDVTYESASYFRMANTFVYSYNKSEKFNFRIGLTKSFLWGNKNYWPFIGFRFGKLDKVNLSIQIPKNISLNVPINSKLRFSLYTKPQGGMFIFSNRDSLDYFRNSSTFQFTRYEINSGFRFDVRLNNNFNFYVAAGLSTKNNITFYSDKANKDRPRLPYRKYFYEQDLAPTGFFNFGLVLKFGKTKSYFNNRNIYDAIDLNNTIDAGDGNTSNGNVQIPVKSEKIKKKDANLTSIQDLIDANDY
ncbi:MAG: DUF6268 family outer membrane beta-barrel protein [Bacteroidota bacterium]|nr:DUF6268 family outer membrane beta-barrel protein [Bacteroidota bacterium]